MNLSSSLRGSRFWRWLIIAIFGVTQLVPSLNLFNFLPIPSAKAETVLEYALSSATVVPSSGYDISSLKPEEIAVDNFDNTAGRSFMNTVWFTLNSDTVDDAIGKLVPSSGAVTIYKITGASNAGPQGIAIDSNHNVWFAEKNANKIGKFDPASLEFVHFDLSTGAQPHGITVIDDWDPDYILKDGIIFTELGNNKIGKITNTSGIGSTPRRAGDCNQTTVVCTITETDVPTLASQPMGMTQYNLQAYFTEYTGNKTATYDPSSDGIFEASMTGGTFSPVNIALRPTGVFLLADEIKSSPSQNRICLVNRCAWHASSTYKYIDLPGSGVEGLAVDAAVNRLWFTENSLNKVGYFDATQIVSGSQAFDTTDVTEIDVPTASSTPHRIAVNTTSTDAYFTEKEGKKIGKVVMAGDFTIAATPSTRTITQGNSTTYTVNTTAVNGGTETVTLSASGLPSGVSAGFSPATVTPGGSSTMTLTASASAATGANTITVNGVGTSNTHTTTVSLTVNAGPNFSVAITPSSNSITQGQSASYTVTLTGSNGYAESVALSASGLPSGASASFSPTSVTPDGSSTLTISTTESATTGTSTVTVTGTGATRTNSNTTSLAISAAASPDFTIISSSNTPTIAQNSSTVVNLTLTSTNGFNSATSLSVSNLPSGVTGTFDSSSPTPTATAALTLAASETAWVGSQTITVTATGGSQTHTVDMTLTVNGMATFSWRVNPSSRSVVQGSSASYLAQVVSYYGFGSPVALSIAGLPTGASATYNSSTAYLTISTGTSTPAGTYTLILTGEGGGITKSTTISLVVSALLPNFSVSPSSGWEGRTITLGASGFPSNTQLSLKWDNVTSFANFTTGDDGTASGTFTVPTGVERARHSLALTTSDGAYAVSDVAFDVVGSWQQKAPSAWNAKISVADKDWELSCGADSISGKKAVTLFGTGFPASVPVLVNRDNAFWFSITTGTNGEFIYQYDVSAEAKRDQEQGYTKTYSYDATTDDGWVRTSAEKLTLILSAPAYNPQFSLAADFGPPGSQIKVTGSGWAGVSGVDFTWDPNWAVQPGQGDDSFSVAQLGSGSIDCAGNLSATIDIPGGGASSLALQFALPGRHYIGASWGDSKVYQPFEVLQLGFFQPADSEFLSYLDTLAQSWYGKKFKDLNNIQQGSIWAMAKGFTNQIYSVNFDPTILNPAYGQMQNQTPSITFGGEEFDPASCSDELTINTGFIQKALAAPACKGKDAIYISDDGKTGRIAQITITYFSPVPYHIPGETSQRYARDFSFSPNKVYDGPHANETAMGEITSIKVKYTDGREKEIPPSFSSRSGYKWTLAINGTFRIGPALENPALDNSFVAKKSFKFRKSTEILPDLNNLADWEMRATAGTGSPGEEFSWRTNTQYVLYDDGGNFVAAFLYLDYSSIPSKVRSQLDLFFDDLTQEGYYFNEDGTAMTDSQYAEYVAEQMGGVSITVGSGTFGSDVATAQMCYGRPRPRDEVADASRFIKGSRWIKTALAQDDSYCSEDGYEIAFGDWLSGGTEANNIVVDKAFAAENTPFGAISDWVMSKLVNVGDKFLTNYLRIDSVGPITLMLVNPVGQAVGWDPVQNVKVDTIEKGQVYIAENKQSSTYVIPDLWEGDYTLRAYGQGDGDYQVDVTVVQGETVTSKSYTGTAKASEYIDGSLTVNFDTKTTKESRTNQIILISALIVLGLAIIIGGRFWLKRTLKHIRT